MQVLATCAAAQKKYGLVDVRDIEFTAAQAAQKALEAESDEEL